MTCIVGMEDGQHVYIGGDSAAISGTALCVRADPKVFRNGDFVFGFTTSFRMGQLLRFSFNPPAHPSGMDDFEYFVALFVDAVRSCLQQGGFAKRKEEQESAGSFLVGYRGRLYTIDSDYQVALSIDGIAAIGSGAQVAIGALYALSRLPGIAAIDLAIVTAHHYPPGNHDNEQGRHARTIQPRQILLAALSAAERWNSTVRRPFTVLGDDLSRGATTPLL